MNYEKRRIIATILAALAGAVWIFVIVSLVVSGCRSAWTWGKTVFFLVTFAVPSALEIRSVWTGAQNSLRSKINAWKRKGPRFLQSIQEQDEALSKEYSYDTFDLWFIPKNLYLLAATLMVAGYIFLDMDDAPIFWSALFLIGLILFLVAAALGIWTIRKISN